MFNTPNSFFGDLSWFQIIVSAVALFTGLWTFAVVPLRQMMKKHPLRVFSADTLGLVLAPAASLPSLLVRLTVVNSAERIVTLSKLHGYLQASNGERFPILWKRLLRYSGTSREVESDVYPVTVGPKGSVPLFVEFSFTPIEQPFHGLTGEFQMFLDGVIDGDRKTTLKFTRNFLIREEAAMLWRMEATRNDQPIVREVELL